MATALALLIASEGSDDSSSEASVYTSCHTSEDKCMNDHNGVNWRLRWMQNVYEGILDQI